MINISEREKQVLDLRSKGYSYSNIAKELNMSKSTVAYFCRKSLNENKVKHNKDKLKAQEEYEQIVCSVIPQAKSMNELCILMNRRGTNNNILFFQKIIEKYNIDTSHFSSIPYTKTKPRKLKFDDIFCKSAKLLASSKVKEYIFKYDIKKRYCECCNNDKWNGKDIPLELHHINGDRFDNRIENLQILCPNSKEIRKLIIEQFGKQPQWYSYMTDEKGLCKRKNLKQIEVYTLKGDYIGLFKSASHVIKEFNLNDRGMVIKVCNGSRKQYGGYMFKYHTV